MFGPEVRDGPAPSLRPRVTEALDVLPDPCTPPGRDIGFPGWREKRLQIEGFRSGTNSHQCP